MAFKCFLDLPTGKTVNEKKRIVYEISSSSAAADRLGRIARG